MSTYRTAPSLRRLWNGTLRQLVALVLGLGVASAGAVSYVATSFAQSTSELERQLAALSAIDVALLDISDPAGELMYSLGSDPQALLDAYGDARARVYAGFDRAEPLIITRATSDRLAQARASWEVADEVVLDAPALVATGEVQAALARGEDPFRDSMWTPYGESGAGISEIQRLVVDDLRERVTAMNRLQRAVILAVAGAVGLSLALGLAATRRIRRRVVDPLVQLRAHALELQHLDRDVSIDLDGTTAELVDLAASINETARSLRATHGRLRDQANTDSLTGLANRKAFTDWVGARFAGPSDAWLSVLFIDLDDFKDVNDSLGHHAGDELLRIVSARLVAATRGCDLVARLGGDEFAVALDAGDNPEGATVVAERILDALAERIVLDGTGVTVGCSIGIASTTGVGTDVQELLRNADIAMYLAKSRGKNCFEVYAATMHAEVLAGMELKRDLAQATRRGELELHYQPVVDLDTGDVLGYEALVRWIHPTRGLLTPAQFIPIAEDTGDIVEIGAWVLDRACRDLAASEGDAPQPWISVNVSPCQLVGGGFGEAVRAALERHGVAPNRLMLEITEAVAVADIDAAATVLDQARSLGVQVALDDFGVGFSSLEYLRRLPIDVLKVDRSFVADEGPNSDSMLEAMIRLARSFGLDVIAEGIEQRWELERLRRFGTLAGQGYLFARPMPIRELSASTGSPPVGDRATGGPPGRTSRTGCRPGR